MRAIEVEKISNRHGKAVRTGTTWHFIKATDPGLTLCGKRRLELPIIAEQDVDALPDFNGCRGCIRAQGDWAQRHHKGDSEQGVYLQPSSGRVRRVGPLSHDTRRSGGHRLR